MEKNTLEKSKKNLNLTSGILGAASSLANPLINSEEDSIQQKGEETLSSVNNIFSKSGLSSFVSDWVPFSKENVGVSALSGATSSAASGAIGGPWTALAGGVLGGLSSAFSASSRNNTREAINEDITKAILSQNNQLSEKAAGEVLANIAAFGGWLNTHGGDYSTGLTKFKEGGQHEENLNGGILQGISKDGTPNLVEEGETKWNDYIFSNRLTVPNTIAKEFNLGKVGKNKTYSKVSEKLSKESKERPFDSISTRGKDAMLSRLQSAQETQKFIDEGDSIFNDLLEEAGYSETLFSKGGQIHINPSKRGSFTAAAKKHGKGVQEFAKQVLSNKDNYSTAMIKKANFARNAAKWHSEGGPITLKDPTTIVEFPDSEFRYNSPDLVKASSNAITTNRSQPLFNLSSITNPGLFAPAIANFGLAVSDLMSKPETVDFNRADLSDYMIRRQLPYEPVDREYLANKYRAQAGATARNIVNMSAGNAASARAALVAHNYNTLNSLGDLYFKSDELNRQRRKESVMFDDAQDKKLASLAGQQFAMNSDLDYKEQFINSQNRAAARNARRSAVSNIGQSIGEISRYIDDVERVRNMFDYDEVGNWLYKFLSKN